MPKLQKLVFVDPYVNQYRKSPYSEDIERLQKIAENRGYELSHQDAISAWKAHSDLYAAGWLVLHGSDEEIWKDIKEHLMPVGE
jgi:hypothetical protein